ncbi:MAG: C-GCAxxG-C-C family protein [Spirochaetaceae bacterium]|jgi:C_GCAxxG_C_C family probable redox protein|nr:C-GCAxxG-C-C family protein [Spirochaetaceae bacterium]
MIRELINNDFGIKEKEDYSCSEKILYGANIVYDLGLEKESLKLAAGLSGGVYTEKLCGAVSSSAMVLAKLFVKDRAHEGEYCGKLIEEFVSRFEKEMKSTTCFNLKEDYRTEEEGCKAVVLKAAELLDEIIIREQNSPLS